MIFFFQQVIRNAQRPRAMTFLTLVQRRKVFHRETDPQLYLPIYPFMAALIVLHLRDAFYVMLSTKFCFLATRYFKNMTRILGNKRQNQNITASHGGKLNCRSACKD